MNMIGRIMIAVFAGCGALHGVVAHPDESIAAADPTGWRQLALDRASSNAAAVTDPYRRAELLASIARAQVMIDDTHAADASIRAALTAAGQIAERAFQDWVLQEIVLAQIASDDMIGARQTADRISTERPQGAALAAIAAIQLRGGYLADAQATAKRIRSEDAAGETLRQVVVVQLAMGATTSARETVRLIEDDFYQALASGDVAVVDVHNADIEQANAMAARARKAHRSQVYGRIALARVDTGDVRGAMATLTKIDDELYRALVQGRIAAHRAAAGDRAQARELFSSALTLMNEARDRDHRKALSLSQLARTQAVSGESAGARECLQRAIAAASTMTNNRNATMRSTSLRAARRVSATATRRLPPQCRLAIGLPRLCWYVTWSRCRQHPAQQARSCSNSAVVRDPLTETAALFGVIGVQLLKSGQSGADETIRAAHIAVRSIDALPMKPAALAALAAARVTIGDAKGGWSIFQESVMTADALERQDQRAAAYVRIFNALDERLIFLGQPVRGDLGPEL